MIYKQDNKIVDRRIQNSGYLRSKRKQIKRHGKMFKWLLKKEINNLERQSNKIKII